MKIAGCVVLFNPQEEVVRNIKSYIHLVDKLYVLDNSSADNSELLEGLGNSVFQYVSLGKNMGIAYALKYAADKAINDGYEFLLTMDQDSVFPAVTREDIVNRLKSIENISDYGVIGLNFNSDSNDNTLQEVKYWLTSGNFINLTNYKLIWGFKPELFIDYVDFDLCEQFNGINKKVAYWKDLSLNHSIGNPKKYNILGIKFCVTNHSPVRYYYRFRNALYLYRQNKKFYRELYLRGLFVDIPKILLFEKEKSKKLKMIKRGRKDAKKGKMGRLEL